MSKNEPMRRAGWRGLVFDSPLRIVIAFVLVIAGIHVAGLISGQAKLTGQAAYSLVLSACVTPVSLLYGFSFRHEPVWSPTLAMWLFAGFLILGCAAVEAIGINRQVAHSAVGGLGALAFAYLAKLWPRIERALPGQRSKRLS